MGNDTHVDASIYQSPQVVVYCLVSQLHFSYEKSEQLQVKTVQRNILTVWLTVLAQPLQKPPKHAPSISLNICFEII